jgi:MoaA/NifB/PqqE/SkfB family radical SAM enzyme
MCFEKLRPPHQELSIEDWRTIIHQVAKFKPRIHISGGEPFVYKPILELIAVIKQRDLFLTITTNGTFLEEHAADLVRMNVNRIHVSIDGPRHIHDSIRDVPGTYDRLVTGLQKLCSLKKSALPVIRINSMINLTEPDANRAVLDIAHELRAESVQLLHPLFVGSQALKTHARLLKNTLGQDINYWHSADIACAMPHDYERIVSSMEQLQKTSSIPVEVFPRLLPEQLKAYYAHDTAFTRLYRGACQAMWYTATILPNGDMESCPDYVVGSCRTVSFLKLWNSDTMRNLRRRIRRRDFFTVCRACCFYYPR